MKDVAIAISIGSPKSTINLVNKTFSSIKQNIGECNWKVFLCIGSNIKPELRKFVLEWVRNNPLNFEIFMDEEVSWAVFINRAIDISKDFEYFIKSHDDIELITPNFFNKTKEVIRNITTPIGWISFTDVGWQKGDFSPSVRIGYHTDRANWNNGKIFQFHKFPNYWYKNNFIIDKSYLLISKIINKFIKIKLPYLKPIKKIKKYELDMPKFPVKCHAPFNHFVMIKRESLIKIGKCEDWNTPNALLVDEDWGLRALKMNMPNIWIPDIQYFHYRGKIRRGGTRSQNDISKHINRVENLFINKWGFHPSPTAKEIEVIKKKYSNTLIPWSSYRNSFDWDYKIL